MENANSNVTDGYEQIFSRDFSGDGFIGIPIVDNDGDGIVDGSGDTEYQFLK